MYKTTDIQCTKEQHTFSKHRHITYHHIAYLFNPTTADASFRSKPPGLAQSPINMLVETRAIIQRDLPSWKSQSRYPETRDDRQTSVSRLVLPWALELV